jgi:hypothetical protein
MTQAHIPSNATRGESYLRLTERGLSFLTGGSQVDGGKYQISNRDEGEPKPEHSLNHSTSFASAEAHESELDIKTCHAPTVKQAQTTDTSLFRDAKVVCKIISENSSTPNWLDICEYGAPYSWVEGGKVGKTFREKPGVSIDTDMAKARFGKATRFALDVGWVSRGWRILNGSDSTGAKVIMMAENVPARALRGESYLRLTKEGASVVKAKPEREDLRSRSLFIKNVPRSVSVEDLVRYLQVNHGCRIVVAIGKEIHPGKGAFWFIRVQVESESEARTLLHLSKQSKLFLQGRQLEVTHDKHLPTAQDLMSDSIYYPSDAGNSTIRKKDPLNVQARLFVKNVSRRTSIQRLVIFLESFFSCTILRAKLQKDRVTNCSQYFFARLELSTSHDATKLMRSSNVELDGRILEFLYDKFPVTTLSGDCIQFPEIFYDRAFLSKKIASTSSETTPAPNRLSTSCSGTDETNGLKAVLVLPKESSPTEPWNDGSSKNDSNVVQGDVDDVDVTPTATHCEKDTLIHHVEGTSTGTSTGSNWAFSRLLRKFTSY